MTRHRRSSQSGIYPAALVLAVHLHTASTALASPSYPGEIQAALGLSCPPRCTLCHQDRQGGLGTIKSASFGETLMNASDLGEDDPATLRCGLELLAPECDPEAPPACAGPDQQCLTADGDGDGMSDIEELRAARDPNVDGEGLLCGATYGCGAELTPRQRGSGALSGWACAAAALCAILLSRGRRAAPRF